MASDSKNVRIWLLLLALTAAEVALAYVKAPALTMLALLVALSVAKSGFIIGWFMHMKFEKRSLRLAIVPIVIVLILSMFAVLPDAHAQCSMCQRTAQAQDPAGVDRLNRAILALIAPPLTILTGIVLHLRGKM